MCILCVFWLMRSTKEKILSILMLIAVVTNNLLYPINYVAADDFAEVEIMSEESVITESTNTDKISDLSENPDDSFDESLGESDVEDEESSTESDNEFVEGNESVESENNIVDNENLWWDGENTEDNEGLSENTDVEEKVENDIADNEDVWWDGEKTEDSWEWNENMEWENNWEIQNIWNTSSWSETWLFNDISWNGINDWLVDDEQTGWNESTENFIDEWDVLQILTWEQLILEWGEEEIFDEELENEENLDELVQIWEVLNEEEILGQGEYMDIIVNVQAPIGAFPEGTELRISPITTKKEIKEIKNQLVDSQENIVEELEFVAFDISFIYTLSDWTEIELQPRENTVKVTFDYSDNQTFKDADNDDSQIIEVYHINDKDENGDVVEKWSEVIEKIEINQTASEEIDNALVIDAENFSIYVLALNPTDTYTLTLDPGEWDIVAWSNIVVDWNWVWTIADINGVVMLPGATRQNYQFSGWYITWCVYVWNSWDSYNVTENITLYAEWQEIMYTVTFDANRWTFADTPAAQIVTSWNYAEEPQTHPELPWYTFTGWWTEPIGGTQWDFANDPVTGNITLYAKWDYNLTYGDLDVYMIDSDGSLVKYVMMDRNMWATSVYNKNFDDQNTGSFGFVYQWWNNYGFPRCNGNGACNYSPITETLVSVDILENYIPSKFASSTWIWKNWDKVSTKSWHVTGDSVRYLWWNGNTIDMQWPCPDGYHVPLANETNNEGWLFRVWGNIYDKTINTIGGKGSWFTFLSYDQELFSSQFLLPHAWAHKKGGTNEQDQNICWDYWTATPTDLADARNMWFCKDGQNSFYKEHGNFLFTNASQRNNWSTLRCFKNSTVSANLNIVNWWKKGLITVEKVGGVATINAIKEPENTDASWTDLKFSGWYTSQNFEPSTMKTWGDTLSALETTLYAKWDCPEGLVYNANDLCVTWVLVRFMDGEIEYTRSAVLSWEKVSAPTDPEKTWHTFTWWFESWANSPFVFTGTPITWDLDLYAHWDINNYDVNVSVATWDEDKGYLSGMWSTWISLTWLYDYGTELVFIAIPELGYVFDYWMNGDQVLSWTDLWDWKNQLTVTVDQVLDIIAFFKETPTPYTVEHYQQNLSQTWYDFVWSGIMYWIANEQTNATGTNYTWFTLSWNLADYQTWINADWSTVVRLYYNRVSVVSYLVTFDADRWTFVSWSISQSIENWALVTPLTEEQKPVFPWYSVDGWYKTNPRLDSNAEEWIFDQDLVTGDITLYAHWTNNYDVRDLDIYFVVDDSTGSYYTIMDRDVWASGIWAVWYQYQWWNNYWFRPCATNNCSTFPGWETTGTNQVDVSDYDPISNPYSSNIYIIQAGNSNKESNWAMGNVNRRDNLWWWVSGTNAAMQWPCPEWYHVPTSGVWKDIHDSWNSINLWRDGCASNSLKTCAVKMVKDLLLVNKGRRDHEAKLGLLNAASYWSSSPDNGASKAYGVYINSNESNDSLAVQVPNDDGRIRAKFVRCVKNDYNTPLTIKINWWTWASLSVYSGSLHYLTNPTKEWYEFSWWYSNLTGNVKIEDGSTLPQGTTTLYAKWIGEGDVEYTFNANWWKFIIDWIESNQFVLTYQNGDSFDPSDIIVPERNCNIFTGWYDAASGGNKIISRDSTVSDSITVYAHWIEWSCSAPTCEFHGQTFADWESVTWYQSNSVTCPGSCIPQVATCNGGIRNIANFETEYYSSCTYSWFSCDAWEYPLSICPENWICSSCTWYTVSENACVQWTPIYKLNSCFDDYHKDGNNCTSNTWSNQCIENWAPSHAHYNTENVVVMWNGSGWSTPSDCTWSCDEHYHTWTNNDSCEIDTFEITWVDGDGNTIYTWDVAYWETPEYTWGIPTKESTTQYTYTFNNTWSPAITSVTEAATYTAQFSSTLRSYEITWKNEDWSIIDTTTVEYGTVPTHVSWTKVGDAQYTYEFAWWSPIPAEVTWAATYTATYNNIVNKYTVIWKNSDWSTIETDTNVPYWSTPSYDGATPTSGWDAQYSYSFNGWSPEVTTVVWNQIYTATYTPNLRSYEITWVDGDGNTIYTWDVVYWETPEYSGATPTKTATAQYTYTFNNTWSPAITNVTEAATYTAQFDSTTNEYEITWKYRDADGERVVETWDVAYWGTLTEPSLPGVSHTQSTVYTFTSWSPLVHSVGGTETYIAQYNETPRAYIITWRNDDNSLIDTTTVNYWVVPTHASGTKAATAEWTYEFAWWSPEPEAVTWEAEYKATYTATKNKYTVTFIVSPTWWWTFWPWSILAEYGSVISTSWNTVTIWWTMYTATPTTADEQYTYVFDEWTNNCGETVTGTCTIVANFDRVVNQYTITFVDEDGETVLKTWTKYDYGTLAENIIRPADPTKAEDNVYTYEFGWWDPEITNVTEDKTYRATYNSHYIDYTITWKDYNGTSLSWATYHYNEDLEVLGNPSRGADETYTYEFSWWTPSIENKVTRNQTYTAEYKATYIDYTIKFVNEWVEISSDTYHYWETVEVPENPSKAEDAQYSYSFNGWSPEVTTVVWNQIYTATYTPNLRSYEITWNDYNNTVIDTTIVSYWTVPTHANPAAYIENNRNYEFTWWLPVPVAVIEDTEYTAIYVASWCIEWYHDDNGMCINEKVWVCTMPHNADLNANYTETWTYVWNGSEWTAPVCEFIGCKNEYHLDWWICVSNNDIVSDCDITTKPENTVVTVWTFVQKWNVSECLPVSKDWTYGWEECWFVCATGYYRDWSTCLIKKSSGKRRSLIKKDYCQDWDCWLSNDDEIWQNHGSAWWEEISPYDECYNTYQWAYQNKIVNNVNISDKWFDRSLTRIEAARLLSNFAINVLWMVPDESRIKTFTDVSNYLDKSYNNSVSIAYKLWIMWINMPNNKFRPYWVVPRAEFVTALSRMMYGTADWQDMYYSTHMDLVSKLWIIKYKDPNMLETIWYALIMLKRATDLLDNDK